LKTCLVYPDLMKFPRVFDKVGGIISKRRSFLPPLGMLYLISNSSKEIDFIDNRISQYSDEELYSKLKDYDIVGFGGSITEVKQAKNVSKMLMNSGITTIYGGPNATISPDWYMNNFDIIVRGEGEITFEEVLSSLENKRILANILGISYKKDGIIVHNPDRQYIQDLDVLKYPSREIIDLKNYSREKFTYLHLSPMDTVISSRGCPFACKFCSSKLIWKQTHRKRQVDKTVEEIIYIINHFGTKSIYFREDLFTIPREWVLKFCKLIKSLEIEWMCESRVDTVDKEMLCIMKDAGCVGMWFGIESCSNITLQLINKQITIEQVRKTVKNCNEVGILCGGTFIFGFPHESKEDILSNFEEAQKIGLNRIGFNRLIGFPRSELYEFFIREQLDRYNYEGIIIPDTKYLHADEVTELGFSKFPEIMKYNVSNSEDFYVTKK